MRLWETDYLVPLRHEAQETTVDRGANGKLQYHSSKRFREIESIVISKNDAYLSYDMVNMFREANKQAHQNVILGQEKLNHDLCFTLIRQVPGMDVEAIKNAILKDSPTESEIDALRTIKPAKEYLEFYDR